MTIINVLPIYVHKHVYLGPEYPYIYVSVSMYLCVPIDAVCVSWHRNGFMLFLLAKKKNKITHASLYNFSTFSSTFFAPSQLDKKEMRVCFPFVGLETS